MKRIVYSVYTPFDRTEAIKRKVAQFLEALCFSVFLFLALLVIVLFS